MNKLWLLFLLVIPYQLIHAQEVQHAATVEQCRADGKLWLSKLEQPNNAGTANVSYSEFNASAHEMNDCMNLDRKFAMKYYNTAVEASSVEETRLVGFVGRHNLFNQFLAEDAQGQGR